MIFIRTQTSKGKKNQDASLQPIKALKHWIIPLAETLRKSIGIKPPRAYQKGDCLK